MERCNLFIRSLLSQNICLCSYYKRSFVTRSKKRYIHLPKINEPFYHATMQPIKNNKLLYSLYVTVGVCGLLFFQSVVLTFTDPYVSLNHLLSALLFSFLQFIPALPAGLLLKHTILLQKKFIRVTANVYIGLFILAVLNLVFIARDALSAGLPIVLIIWPLSLILTLLYAVNSKPKK